MFDVQGHRGARGLRPENTLPAFEIALDLGVSTLELDVHLSADDQVVVWHDPELTNEKCRRVDGPPGSVPSSGKLDGPVPIRSLPVSRFDDFRCDRNPEPHRFPNQVAAAGELAGDDYHPVTLDRLFEFVAEYTTSSSKTASQRENAGRVAFNIETKRVEAQPETIDDDFDGVTAGTFELAVLAAVEDAGMAPRVIVQSFDPRSLWSVRAVRTDIRLSLLTTAPPADFAEIARRGLSIWSPDHTTVTRETVDAAHAAALDVLPWTVNDPLDMSLLRDLGVDGLITDFPNIALKLFGPRDSDSDLA